MPRRHKQRPPKTRKPYLNAAPSVTVEDVQSQHRGYAKASFLQARRLLSSDDLERQYHNAQRTGSRFNIYPR